MSIGKRIARRLATDRVIVLVPDDATLADAVRREIAELTELEAKAAGPSAPLGGWRSTAVRRVAEHYNLNPYALDRRIREYDGT